MEIIVAVTVGLLVTIGIWMLLDRGLLRVVLGIVVLGNGVNLAVFSAGRLDGRAAAFVTEAGAPALAANPLPQALVLTAIVIGFALFVFALAVLKRSFELHGNVETDRITAVAEEPAPDLPAPASPQMLTKLRAEKAALIRKHGMEAGYARLEGIFATAS